MYRVLCSKVLRTLSFCAVLGALLVSVPAYSATVSGPKISVAPKSMNFGLVKLGGTSTQTLTIFNTGTEDLTLNPISVTGTNASDFGPGGYPVTVSAGGSITVDVMFSPQLLPFGKRSAVMTIPSNDPKKPLLNVKLMGQAPGPVVSASPMAVNLGTVELGSKSALAVVVIKNTGVSDLNISSISIGGTDAADFSQSNECPPALATGESCSVDVMFQPSGIGKKSAVLQIASNAPKKPLLLVKLMGIGANPGSVSSPFVNADIVGSWENHILHSGGDWTGWVRGPIAVASDDTFTFDESDSSGGFQAVDGTVSINGSGVIDINCSSCDSDLQMFLDMGKTFAARAKKEVGGSGELSAMAKKADSYSQDDLTGTWHLQGIKAGATPTWNRGLLTIAADGSFTNDETQSDGTSSQEIGHMTISADGAVTIVEAADPALQINMDAGKTLMVATDTTEGGGCDFTVVTKQGLSYATADMAGTWNFEQIEMDAVNGSVSGSGSVKIGKDGAVNGSIIQTDGQTKSISGTLSISATGEITVNGADGTAGYLDAGKTVAVMTELHGSGAVGMSILTKKSN